MRSRYHRVVALVGVALLGLAVAACNPSRSGGGATQGSNAAGEAVMTMKSASPTLTVGVPLTMVTGPGPTRPMASPSTFRPPAHRAAISVDVVLRQAGAGLRLDQAAATVMPAIRQGANLKIIAAVVNNVQVTVLRNDVMPKARRVADGADRRPHARPEGTDGRHRRGGLDPLPDAPRQPEALRPGPGQRPAAGRHRRSPRLVAESTGPLRRDRVREPDRRAGGNQGRRDRVDLRSRAATFRAPRHQDLGDLRSQRHDRADPGDVEAIRRRSGTH